MDETESVAVSMRLIQLYVLQDGNSGVYKQFIYASPWRTVFPCVMAFVKGSQV